MGSKGKPGYSNTALAGVRQGIEIKIANGARGRSGLSFGMDLKNGTVFLDPDLSSGFNEDKVRLFSL